MAALDVVLVDRRQSREVALDRASEVVGLVRLVADNPEFRPAARTEAHVQAGLEPRPLSGSEQDDRRDEQNYGEYAHLDRITWPL